MATGTRVRKSVCGLHGESLALIGPFEGFGGAIVRVNESQHFGLQFRYTSEGATPEQFAHQNGEPYLDLVEPRTLLGRVMEHHCVGGIAQECRTAGHQGEDAIFPFFAQGVLLDARKLGHEAD